DGIRDYKVTGVQTCALPIYSLKNPNVRAVNGATSNGNADIINDPNATYWTDLEGKLAKASLTDKQIEVIWLKTFENASQGFPSSALALKAHLRQIVDIISGKFPNLKIVYVSSRSYGG